MKNFLKFLFVFLCLIILFPVLFYSTISIINNCIATNIEKELVEVELPDNTQLSDSISIAEKIFGNGNGMQYFGAILISSDLSLEELTEYYKSIDESFSVEKKEDNFVISELYDHKFSNFDNNKTNYMVWRIEYNSTRISETGNAFYEFLDWDIRAH